MTTTTEKKLAKKGMGGDNMIAHLTGGEQIIPPEILATNPELKAHIEHAFKRVGGDSSQFIAGSEHQNINPHTKLPEFSFWTSIRNIGEKALGTAAGAAIGSIVPGVGTALGASIGGSLGSAATGYVQGDRGAGLVGDAVGGYVGGGTALTGAQDIGNSIAGAGTFGAGQTVGDAISGLGTSISNGASNLGTALSGGIGGISNYMSGAGSDITSAAGGPVGTGAGMLTGGAAPATGAGVAGTTGYGGQALNLLNKAPTWLAPAASLASGGLQYESGQNAIDAEKKALATQQGIEKPFVDAGVSASGAYNNLATSPQAQKDFVANNPFYNSLADDAQRRLLASGAASGKAASGGTQAALQDQLLQLGTGLVNNQLQQLQVPLTTGANAAAGVSSAVGNTGTNVANLTTQQGNAAAGGVVGASNASTANYNNQIGTLLALQNLQNKQSMPAQYQPLSL